MPYQAISGTGPTNVDLTTKGKRCTNWHLATTSAVAGVINFRDGGIGGPVVARVNLAGNSSASQSKKHYARHLLHFSSGGCFVEIVSSVIVGSIDLN